jgi:hypothetical protein
VRSQSALQRLLRGEIKKKNDILFVQISLIFGFIEESCSLISGSASKQLRYLILVETNEENPVSQRYVPTKGKRMETVFFDSSVYSCFRLHQNSAADCFSNISFCEESEIKSRYLLVFHTLGRISFGVQWALDGGRGALGLRGARFEKRCESRRCIGCGRGKISVAKIRHLCKDKCNVGGLYTHYQIIFFKN